MRAQSERVLLAGATIVSCAGGAGELPYSGDILIEGDRIVDVFAGIAPVDRASVRSVDLAGGTVLPGLADAHAPLSWPPDFVFDHPGVKAMPDDVHALEVAGVVRTFLAHGYTL